MVTVDETVFDSMGDPRPTQGLCQTIDSEEEIGYNHYFFAVTNANTV